jgi:hypothetical protein
MLLTGLYTGFGRARFPRPQLLIEWALDGLLPLLRPPGTSVTVAHHEIAHSLGIILFGLVGAAAGRLIAGEDKRTRP